MNATKWVVYLLIFAFSLGLCQHQLRNNCHNTNKSGNYSSSHGRKIK